MLKLKSCSKPFLFTGNSTSLTIQLQDDSEKLLNSELGTVFVITLSNDKENKTKVEETATMQEKEKENKSCMCRKSEIVI